MSWMKSLKTYQAKSMSHESKCLTWEKNTSNPHPDLNIKANLNSNPNLGKKTADWLS